MNHSLLINDLVQWNLKDLKKIQEFMLSNKRELLIIKITFIENVYT